MLYTSKIPKYFTLRKRVNCDIFDKQLRGKNHLLQGDEAVYWISIGRQLSLLGGTIVSIRWYQLLIDDTVLQKNQNQARFFWGVIWR